MAYRAIVEGSGGGMRYRMSESLYVHLLLGSMIMLALAVGFCAEVFSG